MNERIREIADEAFKGLGTNPVYATAMIYASKELEKFAELIVRECADQVDNLVTSDDEGNQILDCDDIKTELLEHFFGVEE